MKHRFHSLASLLLAACLVNLGSAAPANAADVSATRATPEQSAVYISVPLKASTTIYAGRIVCVDTGGYARGSSQDASGYVCVGVAAETKVGSGTDGGESIKVKRGTFKFDNSVSNAVTEASVGKLVYVQDNHTLSISTSNAVIAGICVKVESDGVWIDCRALTQTVGTPSNDSITSAKIVDGTIAAADLATGSVTTAKILDGTILAGDLATGAVTTTAILDGTILAGDFAAGAVDTTAILDGTIAAADLASDAVTTVKILDANVTGAKLSAAGYTRTIVVPLGTIATTGATTITIPAPQTGTLTAVKVCAKDALATSDSNYITFALTNKGQSGAGSTAMLSATASGTTKATGGAAIAAYTTRACPLHATGGNAALVAGDCLELSLTATGTLANTVTETTISLSYTFSN